MTSRARIRVGREVNYFPTAAEETALGAGPWPAKIAGVNADGSVNLDTTPPVQGALGAALTDPLVTAADPAAVAEAALADPLVTSADGSDAGTTQTLANEMKADLNLAVTLVNELRATAIANRALAIELKADVNAVVTRLNQLVSETGESRKSSVTLGGNGGQFSLVGDPAFV